jgi:hypothetical protein
MAEIGSSWWSFLASPLEESLRVEDHNSHIAVAMPPPKDGALFNAELTSPQQGSSGILDGISDSIGRVFAFRA